MAPWFKIGYIFRMTAVFFTAVKASCRSNVSCTYQFVKTMQTEISELPNKTAFFEELGFGPVFEHNINLP